MFDYVWQFYLFIYLFIYLFVYLFICLYIYLIVYLFVYIFIQSFICFTPSINQSFVHQFCRYLYICAFQNSKHTHLRNFKLTFYDI